MTSNHLIPQFDSTPLFLSQNEPNQRNYVTFIFSEGTSITYDIQILKDIGPAHYSKLSFLLTQDATIKIKLPDYIGLDELKNFICMIKNGIFLKSQNFFNNFVSTIQTSEFFQNKQLTSLIINDLALKTLEIRNSFGYIDLAYDKIRNHTDKKIPIDKAWHNLFFSAINLISDNFIGVLKNDEFATKINQLDHRLKEEVILRVIHLYYNSQMDIEDNEDRVLVINFIAISRRKINVFELLSNEYLSLLSEAMNDKSWGGDYTPAFHIDLSKNMRNLYEEYEIEYSLHKIGILLEYNNANDTLIIKLKLKEDKEQKEAKLKIITFISQVVIEKKEIAPVIYTISCDNTMITLLQINNLSAKYNIINNKSTFQMNQEYHLQEVIPLEATIEKNGVIQLVNGLNRQLFRDDYLQISLRLKICYVYSFLSSFLLDNFGLFFRDDKVTQLTHNLLCALIKNTGDKTHDSNKALMLLNWLSDERNGTDSLDDIFRTIKWCDVDIQVLFDIIISLNDNNQRLLRETLMQEEFKMVDKTDFIKKILVIGKKIDYGKMVGICNKIQINNETKNNNSNCQDKHNEDNCNLEKAESCVGKMEKYDFSYTVTQAVKVINNKNENMF